MCESHLGVVSISSSIIFLKEPSVNPFVGDPLHNLVAAVGFLLKQLKEGIHY